MTFGRDAFPFIADVSPFSLDSFPFNLPLLDLPTLVASLFATLTVLLLVCLWTVRIRAGLEATRRDRESPDAARPSQPPRPRKAWPRVSIHLPISSEPPELVARTLDSLVELDYPSYEIIVLDNNTSDPALWRPVEEHCRHLDAARSGTGSGPRVRFEHVERLEGFKAAALDRCLELATPDAELIFVVDADYRVTPLALTLAVRCLDATDTADGRPSDASFVQLPQAYESEAFPASVLEDELWTFFSTVATCADARASMLPTGTLLLVRREALRRCGGWRTRSVTEDADLGRRLLTVGRRGRYLHHVAGRGQLPVDWKGLCSQRSRWAAGNLQVALECLRGRDGRRSLRPLALQLTAWWSFLWLPALALVATAVLPAASPWRVGGPLWALAVAIEIVGTLAFYLVAVDRRSPARRLAVAGLHLALARVQSVALFGAFSRRGRTFVRTDKFRRRARLRPRAQETFGLALAGLFLLAASLHLRVDASAAALACGALAVVALLEPFFALEWRWIRRSDRRAPLASSSPGPADWSTLVGSTQETPR